MKRVALIGSSGGGTATLGHTDPVAFLRAVDRQLQSITYATTRNNHGIPAARLVAALFVALDNGKGMDSIANNNNDNNVSARLFQLHQVKGEYRYEIVALGSLAQVNRQCRQLQETLLAAAIRDHAIDGLICVSCHVEIFRETLQEAAAAATSMHYTKFPVTDSGGTSLAKMVAQFGIQLAGNAGGSVATTSATKAVSYAHALATALNLTYEPWKKRLSSSSSSSSSLSSTEQDQSTTHHRPSWTSVLNSCIPAFWGVCLTKKILMAVQYYTTAPTADDDDDFNLVNTMLESVTHTIVALEHYTFPTVCAVLMATSLHGNNSNSNNETTTLSSESSVIMAAIVASSSCYDSIVSGLWAGYLVISWSDRCLYAAICNNLPATMTSLLCGGGLGGVIAIFVLPVAQILRFATASFRHLLSTLIMTRPWGMWLAFGLGCLSCYGSKVGWYHSVHLPLILIEMEMGNASFLGAIDELTLVLVCAGVCAAILFPSIRQRDISEQADVFLCRRGLGVNICCGDFVEVCYPYMEKSIIVSVGGYLASGSACAWLVWRGNQTDALPESMAYLPWPVAVGLASEHSLAMLESSMVAFLLAFAFAMLR